MMTIPDRSLLGTCAVAGIMLMAVSWTAPAMAQGKSGQAPGNADPPAVGGPIQPVPVAPNAAERSAEALKRLEEETTVPEGYGDIPPGTPAPNPFSQSDPTLQTEGPEGSLSTESFDSESESFDSSGVDELSDPDVLVNGINTGSNPPDTVGDVGPDHYVQMVNATFFQVFDKDGVPTANGPVSFGSLWPAGDPCAANLGDPIVVYDHLADRWVMVQFNSDAQDYLCFAVSQGPSPEPETDPDTWFLYTVPVPAFPDYMKVGVWPDAYYLTTHEGGTSGIFAFDRANMLNGNMLTFVKFDLPKPLPEGGIRNTRTLPADLDGPEPPAGTPGLFVRTVDNRQDTIDSEDRIELFEFAVDWSNPAASTFSMVQDIRPADGLVEFAIMACDRNGNGIRDCVPVPNGGTVDALSNRPMMQLKYRNFGDREVMVFNQTVDVTPALNALTPGLGFTVTDETAGVRWYELSRDGGPDWDIFQQGTYALQDNPADETELLHRWMGSAALDRFGNISIGYSVGDASSVHPGIRYAGRIAADPLGLLPQGEKSIVEGTTSTAGFGGRWGDYSAAVVDPVDDCTFWYTSHISGGEAQRTRIASFRFGDCQADLSIVKAGNPDPVLAGEQLKYTISVTNNGILDATGVIVTDTLPAGVSFVADSLPSPECFDTTEPELICNLGPLAAGESTSFDLTVLVDSDILFVSNGPTEIENTASVEADQNDGDESNNTDTVVTLVNEQADLIVTKICKPDGPASSGDQATCNIIVDNAGPSGARNVTLTDEIFSDGDFTLASFGSTQGTCSEIDGDVVCALGNIDAGERVTVVVTVESDEGADVNDKATVTSETPDPNSGNNMDQGSVSFTGSADLGVEKTAPPTVVAGTNMTYEIGVTNNGPSTAANVLVEDNLPAGVSIISVSGSGGASCNAGVPGDSSQPTSCAFDSMGATDTESMTITVFVAPDTTGTLKNDVRVSSDTADGNNANDLDTTFTEVEAEADLSIVKTTATPNPSPSETIIFHLTAHNESGPSDAQNVVVVDQLPVTGKNNEPIEIVFISEECVISNVLQVTCTTPTIKAGEFAQHEIHIQVNGSVKTLENVASVSSNTTDPDPSNNEDTLTLVIKGGPKT